MTVECPSCGSPTPVLAALRDGNAKVRRRALEGLLADIGSAGKAAYECTGAQQAPLWLAIVTAIEDPSEGCRLSAIKCVKAMDTNYGAPDQLLQALAGKFGINTAAEAAACAPAAIDTSEDVRLAAMQLIRTFLGRSNPEAKETNICAIVRTFCSAVADPWPEVQKEACDAIGTLCNTVSAAALQPHHGALLSAIVPVLSHKQWKLRLQSLAALHAVASTESIAVLLTVDRSLPEHLIKLACDPLPAVRRATFDYVAAWIQQDRQSFPELLPPLLLGLTDAEADLPGLCLAHIAAAGEAYIPLNQGSRTTVAEGSEDEIRRMMDDLCPALLSRARIGLEGWTAEQRGVGARLLQGICRLAAASPALQLHAMLPMLCTAAGDGEGAIAEHAVQAARLIGVAASLAAWLPHMLSAIGGTDQQGTANVFVVLSAMLHAAAAAAGGSAEAADAHQPQQTAALGDASVPEVSDAIGPVSEAAEVLLTLAASIVHAAPLRHQIVAGVGSIITLAGNQCNLVGRPLFEAMLHLQATESDFAERGTLLQHLAVACGLRSAEELAATHAAALLEEYAKGCGDWDASSPNLQAFTCFMLTWGAAAIRQARGSTLAVMSSCVSDRTKLELRMTMLQLAEGMFSAPAVAAELSAADVDRLLEQVVLPCLPWRAGAASAAVRAAALSALTAAFDSHLVAPASAGRLAAEHKLLKGLFPALSDSVSAAGRAAGVRAVRLVITAAGGGLGREDRTAACKKLTKRLEDTNDDVRVAACGALRELLRVSGGDLNDTEEVQALRESLSLHAGDGNPAVQAAARSALQALACAA